MEYSLFFPPLLLFSPMEPMKDIKAYYEKEKDWMMKPLNCCPSTFLRKISLRIGASLALNGVKCTL